MRVTKEGLHEPRTEQQEEPSLKKPAQPVGFSRGDSFKQEPETISHMFFPKESKQARKVFKPIFENLDFENKTGEAFKWVLENTKKLSEEDLKYQFPEQHKYAGYTLAEVAILENNLDALKVLLEKGVNLNSKIPVLGPQCKDMTLAQTAFNLGRADAFFLLIQAGAKFSAEDADYRLPENEPWFPNMSLTQKVLVEGNTTLLAWLFEKGFRFSAKDIAYRFSKEDEEYPNINLAQMLLLKNDKGALSSLVYENGIKLSDADLNQELPQTQPQFRPGMSFARLIADWVPDDPELFDLVYKANPEYRFPKTDPKYPGMSFIQVAVQKSNLSVLEFLLRNGAKFSAEDANYRFPETNQEYPGMSLIQAVVSRENWKAFWFLLDRGGELSTKDANVRLSDQHPQFPGMSLLQVVLVNGYTKALKGIQKYANEQNTSLPKNLTTLEQPKWSESMPTLSEGSLKFRWVSKDRPEIEKKLSSMPLGELLDSYEEFKIGRLQSLNGKSVISEQLDDFLGQVRQMISAKIHEAKALDLGLKEKITHYKCSAAVAQFSNGLRSAHRRGIQGEGVGVTVVDDTHRKHGFLVEGIVRQLAPRVTTDKLDFYKELPSLSEARIINASFESLSLTETSPTLKQVIEESEKALVVHAAGNRSKSFDFPEDSQSRVPDQEYLKNLEDQHRNKLILTGNLEAGNVLALSSNRPGKDPRINEHFLWTLGSDVLSNVSETNIGRETGTSLSAPVVSGAAALILGKYPEFSAQQLKECLLESADQDFWITPKQGPKVHIVPPGASLKASGDEVVIGFDKEIFGKGILNIGRALRYAALKKEHPKATPPEIRYVLDQTDTAKSEQAAQRIQKFVRAKKVPQ